MIKQTMQADYNGLTVVNYEVFGWRMHNNVLPVGAKIIVNYAKDVAHNKLSYINFYTKGKALAVHSNPAVETKTRLAGQFSLDRADKQYAGTLTTTAVEDTEIWCINYHVNNKSFPKISALVVKAGTTHKFKKNDIVLLCQGSFGNVIGPAECSGLDTITAIEDCYFWILDKVGPF